MNQQTKAQIVTRGLALIGVFAGLPFLYFGVVLCLTGVGALFGIPMLIIGITLTGGCGIGAFGRLG